jgi:hypothetical protein
LFANLEKCTFCTDRVAFIGYVVTPQGIEVDEAKIEAIKGWPIPATLTQLWSFLGLAGFYRRFVRNFSTIAAPLNDLTKKGVPFYWGCCTRTFFQHSHRQVNSCTATPDFLISVRLLSLNVMLVELELVVCCYMKVIHCLL